MEIASLPITDILDGLNDGLYLVDLERRITYWNRAAERITGYKAGDVTGQFCQSNILMHCSESGEPLCLGPCPLARTLRDGQTREALVYLHHAAGHRVPVNVRVMPVIEGGLITGAVEIFTEDISLALALDRIEELQKVVMLDPLTGIGNRRMIHARLELADHDWAQRGVLYGMVMADIDHFKMVNDAFGHETGDRVLKMVAASMSAGLRAHDYLGRWGGEEFVALICGIDASGLEAAAERLRMLVERSVIFPDHDDRRDETGVGVTISLGAALVQPGDTLDSLLERADRALYASKSMGRNRVTML